MTRHQRISGPFPYKKIYIVGVSGAGKSDLSARMSSTLAIPHVELDSLYWKPNWVGSTHNEMNRNIQRELDKNKWIIDGRQDFSHDTIIAEEAQVIIWLDLALYTIAYQVLIRTFLRALKREKLWAGNIENSWLAIVNWLRFTLGTYDRIRQKYLDQYARSTKESPVLIRLQNRRQIKDFLATL